jgi:hypothetical protein
MLSSNKLDTLNTTRVCAGNHYQNAIEISKVVYTGNPPGSVIITNGELFQDAIAATPIIHFPRNAPILYSHMNYIDSDTVDQIYRLKPKGVNGYQIFMVGGVSYRIWQYLTSLGFRIQIITGSDYNETAANVAKYLNYPENIMIVSSEDFREGLAACAWSAHMGDPILFTTRDELPSVTIDAIKRTKNAHVFMIGSINTISEAVEARIKSMDVTFVDRISGNTPYEIAVNFAKYKSPKGHFGWDKTERNGHAFTFTSLDNPFNNATGSIFAHLGKHSPILTVNKNLLPDVTRQYIESVKPIPAPEPKPPFMHGWIIGCENDISINTQLEINKALSIDEAHMHH